MSGKRRGRNNKEARSTTLNVSATDRLSPAYISAEILRQGGRDPFVHFYVPPGLRERKCPNEYLVHPLVVYTKECKSEKCPLRNNPKKQNTYICCFVHKERTEIESDVRNEIVSAWVRVHRDKLAERPPGQKATPTLTFGSLLEKYGSAHSGGIVVAKPTKVSKGPTPKSAAAAVAQGVRGNVGATTASSTSASNANANNSVANNGVAPPNKATVVNNAAPAPVSATSAPGTATTTAAMPRRLGASNANVNLHAPEASFAGAVGGGGLHTSAAVPGGTASTSAAPLVRSAPATSSASDMSASAIAAAATALSVLDVDASPGQALDECPVCGYYIASLHESARVTHLDVCLMRSSASTTPPAEPLVRPGDAVSVDYIRFEITRQGGRDPYQVFYLPPSAADRVCPNEFVLHPLIVYARKCRSVKCPLRKNNKRSQANSNDGGEHRGLLCCFSHANRRDMEAKARRKFLSHWIRTHWAHLSALPPKQSITPSGATVEQVLAEYASSPSEAPVAIAATSAATGGTAKHPEAAAAPSAAAGDLGRAALAQLNQLNISSEREEAAKSGNGTRQARADACPKCSQSLASMTRKARKRHIARCRGGAAPAANKSSGCAAPANASGNSPPMAATTTATPTMASAVPSSSKMSETQSSTVSSTVSTETSDASPKTSSPPKASFSVASMFQTIAATDANLSGLVTSSSSSSTSSSGAHGSCSASSDSSSEAASSDDGSSDENSDDEMSSSDQGTSASGARSSDESSDDVERADDVSATGNAHADKLSTPQRRAKESEVMANAVAFASPLNAVNASTTSATTSSRSAADSGSTQQNSDDEESGDTSTASSSAFASYRESETTDDDVALDDSRALDVHRYAIKFREPGATLVMGRAKVEECIIQAYRRHDSGDGLIEVLRVLFQREKGGARRRTDHVFVVARSNFVVPSGRYNVSGLKLDISATLSESKLRARRAADLVHEWNHVSPTNTRKAELEQWSNVLLRTIDVLSAEELAVVLLPLVRQSSERPKQIEGYVRLIRSIFQAAQSSKRVEKAVMKSLSNVVRTRISEQVAGESTSLLLDACDALIAMLRGRPSEALLQRLRDSAAKLGDSGGGGTALHANPQLLAAAATASAPAISKEAGASGTDANSSAAAAAGDAPADAAASGAPSMARADDSEANAASAKAKKKKKKNKGKKGDGAASASVHAGDATNSAAHHDVANKPRFKAFFLTEQLTIELARQIGTDVVFVDPLAQQAVSLPTTTVAKSKMLPFEFREHFSHCGFTIARDYSAPPDAVKQLNEPVRVLDSPKLIVANDGGDAGARPMATAKRYMSMLELMVNPLGVQPKRAFFRANVTLCNAELHVEARVDDQRRSVKFSVECVSGGTSALAVAIQVFAECGETRPHLYAARVLTDRSHATTLSAVQSKDEQPCTLDALLVTSGDGFLPHYVLPIAVYALPLQRDTSKAAVTTRCAACQCTLNSMTSGALTPFAFRCSWCHGGPSTLCSAQCLDGVHPRCTCVLLAARAPPSCAVCSKVLADVKSLKEASHYCFGCHRRFYCDARCMRSDEKHVRHCTHDIALVRASSEHMWALRLAVDARAPGSSLVPLNTKLVPLLSDSAGGAGATVVRGLRAAVRHNFCSPYDDVEGDVWQPIDAVLVNGIGKERTRAFEEAKRRVATSAHTDARRFSRQWSPTRVQAAFDLLLAGRDKSDENAAFADQVLLDSVLCAHGEALGMWGRARGHGVGAVAAPGQERTVSAVSVCFDALARRLHTVPPCLLRTCGEPKSSTLLARGRTEMEVLCHFVSRLLPTFFAVVDADVAVVDDVDDNDDCEDGGKSADEQCAKFVEERITSSVRPLRQSRVTVPPRFAKQTQSLQLNLCTLLLADCLFGEPHYQRATWHENWADIVNELYIDRAAHIWTLAALVRLCRTTSYRRVLAPCDELIGIVLGKACDEPRESMHWATVMFEFLWAIGRQRILDLDGLRNVLPRTVQCAQRWLSQLRDFKEPRGLMLVLPARKYYSGAMGFLSSLCSVPLRNASEYHKLRMLLFDDEQFLGTLGSIVSHTEFARLLQVHLPLHSCVELLRHWQARLTHGELVELVRQLDHHVHDYNVSEEEELELLTRLDIRVQPKGPWTWPQLANNAPHVTAALIAGNRLPDVSVMLDFYRTFDASVGFLLEEYYATDPEHTLRALSALSPERQSALLDEVALYGGSVPLEEMCVHLLSDSAVPACATLYDILCVPTSPLCSLIMDMYEVSVSFFEEREPDGDNVLHMAVEDGRADVVELVHMHLVQRCQQPALFDRLLHHKGRRGKTPGELVHSKNYSIPGGKGNGADVLQRALMRLLPVGNAKNAKK